MVWGWSHSLRDQSATLAAFDSTHLQQAVSTLPMTYQPTAPTLESLLPVIHVAFDQTYESMADSLQKLNPSQFPPPLPDTFYGDFEMTSGKIDLTWDQPSMDDRYRKMRFEPSPGASDTESESPPAIRPASSFKLEPVVYKPLPREVTDPDWLG